MIMECGYGDVMTVNSNVVNYLFHKISDKSACTEW